MDKDIHFLDIGEVKDDDEILMVRFACGASIKGGICGRTIQIVSLEMAGGTLVQYSQDPCPTCRQYSGFQYEGNSADTPSDLNQLRDLLQAENLRQERMRSVIQERLEGRNLKVAFGVKRAQ